MLRVLRLLIAVLIWLGTSSVASAHPGHSHRQPGTSNEGHPQADGDRTWTAASGAFRERGSFVMARKGLVQIRRPDDSLVAIPIRILDVNDQNWIDHRMTEIQRLASANRPLRLTPEHDDARRALMAAGDPPAGIELVPVPIPAAERTGEWLMAQLQTQKARPRSGRGPVPEIAWAFETYVERAAIKTRWDDRYFYVESSGIPDHPMMVGIRSWQQQVPIPQKYTGDNAWRIPLHPVPARNPRSTNGNFLRGAIAVAVNGVPIFNPLNNRGEDAYLFGELDDFGGHCGRADDYHYHLPPVHLEDVNGKAKPIAYALDGYAIFGYTEPDGSPVEKLDRFNGHASAGGKYHYHATRKYPYLNGGFHGEVTERGGQVDPQPQAQPIRPALRPLRGATITKFEQTTPGTYELTYSLQGNDGKVRYTLAKEGSARFVYVEPDGTTWSESYAPGRRGPGGNDRRPPPARGDRPPDDDRPPPPGDDRPRRPGADRPRPDPRERAAMTRKADGPQLVVTSSSIAAGGLLSVDCTCDGHGFSPAVEWKNAPAGTKWYAVSLWHIAPDQEKSYWVVYNIPADVTGLPRNSRGIGQIGRNDRDRAEYDPMCSRGPGLKTYHITVFALSEKPRISPEKASRRNLLAAIKDITLAEGTLDVQYERRGSN